MRGFDPDAKTVMSYSTEAGRAIDAIRLQSSLERELLAVRDPATATPANFNGVVVNRDPMNLGR